MTEPLSKVCTKCDKKKPLDKFSLAKGYALGRHSVCRSCRSLQKKAEQQAWKSTELEPQYGKKICSKCDAEKDLSEFRDTVHGKRNACRECERLTSKHYHDTHEEEDAAYRHEYYLRDPEKHRQRSHDRYHSLTPEEKQALHQERAPYQAWYQDTHREILRDQKAIYYTENLGIFAVHRQRRRARKKNLPDTWTPEQEAFMHAYWQNSCAVCGNMRGFFWQLACDHWVPLSSPECPGTIATNMVPLCSGDGGCNNSKWKSEPHAWLLRRYGSKKAAKIEKAIATYFAIVAERFGEAVA